MLPKLVLLCATQLEDELPRAGYIASKSTHPDWAYFCKVCNFEYRDEVCKAFSVMALYALCLKKTTLLWLSITSPNIKRF